MVSFLLEVYGTDTRECLFALHAVCFVVCVLLLYDSTVVVYKRRFRAKNDGLFVLCFFLVDFATRIAPEGASVSGFPGAFWACILILPLGGGGGWIWSAGFSFEGIDW